MKAVARYWRDETGARERGDKLYKWVEGGKKQADEIADLVIKHFARPKDVSIVDYACGDGRISIPLSQHFRHVVAADINQARLEYEHFSNPPNLEKVLIRDLEHWQTRADVVFSCHFLFHLDWWDAARMLGRFAEWSNALVIVQLPLYEEPMRTAGRNDVSVWTPAMFEVAAGAAGLHILESKSDPGSFPGEPGPNHYTWHVLTV